MERDKNKTCNVGFTIELFYVGCLNYGYGVGKQLLSKTPKIKSCFNKIYKDFSLVYLLDWMCLSEIFDII